MASILTEAQQNTNIAADVFTNTNGSTTGDILQARLLDMVKSAAQRKRDATAETGNIKLDDRNGYVYGFVTALTGNITIDDSTLVVGAWAILKHNHTAAPTFSSSSATVTVQASKYLIEKDNFFKILVVATDEVIVTSYVPEANAFITITDEDDLEWPIRGTDGSTFAIVNLAATRTLLEPTEVSDADELTLLAKQDATGGRQINWPANFKFQGVSELRAEPSGYDIVKAVYNESDDTFYCWFPGQRGYREHHIFAGSSAHTFDINSLADREILAFDGKGLFLNGSSSASGSIDASLPALSKVPFEFRMPIIISQPSINGGELKLKANSTDIFYLNGFDEIIPILDTVSSPQMLIVKASHLAFFRCDLVVRNGLPTGTGLYKVWGIENVKYSTLGYCVKSSVTADPNINRLDCGYKIELNVTGNFTLEIPSGYTEGEEVEIIINQDATGRSIPPGAGWKTSGGSWIGSTANASYKIKATYQGSDIWFTEIFGSYVTPV